MYGPDSGVVGHTSKAADMPRLRILTWHVHGNYLYSLGHLPHDIYVPVSDSLGPGYGRLGTRIPWGSNMHELPASTVANQQFDCILYQAQSHWDNAQSILSPCQKTLPSVYLEHNPPAPHAAESRHFFRHERGLLVHVTPYNALMWDNGDMPVRIVEHGVAVPPAPRPSETLPRGITAINHMHRRGRRLGADLFDMMRLQVALDLIGMDSERHGGLGELPNMEVAAFMARYRYFFSPVRYGSLSLALIEAMMVGLPVVGVATTELPCVITNGVHGYVDTNLPRVSDAMYSLQSDKELGHRWGAAAQRMARARFGIDRFVEDWNSALASVVEVRHG